MSKKEAVKQPPQVKRIRVVLQLEGAMIDKDTPLTEQSAQDYLELHFQCPKGLKAHVIKTEDVTE